MNQGKLEVVKQEMARVDVDILGISFWNGLEWVNLIQMTIISTTAGRNPSEEMEWTSWSTKESEMQYSDAISKTMISVSFQGKPFNITVIQVYTLTSNAEEAEIEWFCEDLLEKAMVPHSSTLAWRIPGMG